MSSSVEKIPQIPPISLAPRPQTIRHPDKMLKTGKRCNMRVSDSQHKFLESARQNHAKAEATRLFWREEFKNGFYRENAGRRAAFDAGVCRQADRDRAAAALIPKKENARGERAFSTVNFLVNLGVVGVFYILTWRLWGAGKEPREFTNSFFLSAPTGRPNWSAP